MILSPVDRIEDVPMLGLAVRSDLRQTLGAHRVMLLVQGTCTSKLDALETSTPLQEQSFSVLSKKVRCLLSDAEKYIDLVGYCDFNGMLTYRLDTDTALVLISAISPVAPDSVSAGTSSFVATIEHMRKISADEKNSLLESLAVEWKSVLVNPVPAGEGVSSRSPEYWDTPTSKLRRVESEPVSPNKNAM